MLEEKSVTDIGLRVQNDVLQNYFTDLPAYTPKDKT